MDKFDRIYRLHAVLNGRKSAISAGELLEKLGCSRATLHRDIALLKDYLHAPLEFDAEDGGYRFSTASRTYELPGLWFSAAELQALVFLQRLVEDSGGGILQEEIKTLSRHLSELTKHKHLHLEEASTRLRFPALIARSAGPAFAAVLSSTLRRKQLRFGYHSRGSDEHTDRVVSPQRVVHYREAWYMDAWDEVKQELRSFSVDRMSNANVQDTSARAVPESELDEHFGGAFGIFGGRPDKTAVLLFTMERARWVADEAWHPRKTARHLEDGSYELSVPYRDSRELVMEILRHGPHVKVIAPESLRQEVAQQLSAALGQYTLNISLVSCFETHPAQASRKTKPREIAVATYQIFATIAGACGFALAWLIQASKLAGAQATSKSQIDALHANVQSLEKDIVLERTALAELRELHITESRSRAAAEAIADQVPELRDQLGVLQSQLRDHAVRAAELETSLAASQLANKEQRDLLDKAQQSFESSFKALSADALRNNNQSFLELAQSNFATLQGEAKSNLDARQLAVDQLVQPIKDQLAKVDTKLGELEMQRVGAYSAIHDQLKILNEATLPDIRKETGSLVKALRQPMVRGRYGEMQLKRVVEMAGMLDHCDFIEQANRETEDGRLRPDMVVKLPGGRNIVIDAKTPIMAYLEALETSDEEAQRACMLQHAEQFRRHVTALGRKSYWDQFTPTPEMVVMFVPGEVFYSAALQADPTLLESSAAEKVVLTTPATLIALLRAVAYGWRHEKLAQNAEEIAKVGRELFDRLSGLAKHWSDVGTGLTKAVEAYNRSTGTLESRVLVSARRLKDLKTAPEEAEIVVVKQVELQARLLQAEEFTVPSIQGIQPVVNGSHLS